MINWRVVGPLLVVLAGAVLGFIYLKATGASSPLISFR